MSASLGHMSTDTDVPNWFVRDGDGDYEIGFREDQFDLMTTLLGCRTERARARAAKVDPKNLRRARNDIIGERFMARVVAGLSRYADQLAHHDLTPSLDALFTVRPKQNPPAGKAA